MSTIGIFAASPISSLPIQDMLKPYTFSQNGRLVPPLPNPATNCEEIEREIDKLSRTKKH
jgi:hypothetical protein